MEKIDRKFIITAFHATKNTRYTEDDSILMLAKDDAVVPTLRFYLEECKRQGAGPAQIQAVKLLIWRVERWRAENAIVCKVPDVDEGMEESVVCRPNEI